jgi:threonine dehydrogenase-like Zn-dependent dehydrogenase
MKAMVLSGPSQMALEDVSTPKPGAGQVLIRVTHSGICGTDY